MSNLGGNALWPVGTGTGSGTAQGLAQALSPAGERVFYLLGQAALRSSATRNFISNASFVVGLTGVVIIEALGSPVLTKALHEIIASKTNLPVVAVVVTH
ncbi:MAG: hypothetical protein U5L74_03115 [Ideonella sp.]|nr:hypothetical protein [Ideonella sp.]